MPTKEYYRKNKERIQQHVRERRKELLSDPQSREHLRLLAKLANVREREKILSDPQLREQFLQRRREIAKKYATNHPERVFATKEKFREKLRNDPQLKEHKKSVDLKARINCYERMYIEARTALETYFPSLTCVICGGNDKRARLGVSFHEIHGKNHELSASRRKWAYIIEHHEDFVPLCREHHLLAHILMRDGFSWERILGEVYDNTMHRRIDC